MPHSQGKDIKTTAYVLRRTNYGEADRILNLITPEGKLSAVARGVRKEKSKLAGSIEMFSRIEVNIHQGRSELGVLTSAKMLQFYSPIISDLNKMELAARILKRVSLAAEGADSPEYFKLVDESFASLGSGISGQLVEGWFLLNLLRISGEEINLYRDTTGTKLSPDNRYSWHGAEMSFAENPRGEIGVSEIKLMRLMATSPLDVIARVKDASNLAPVILQTVQRVGR